jgi:hypothetical protein
LNCRDKFQLTLRQLAQLMTELGEKNLFSVWLASLALVGTGLWNATALWLDPGW